MTAGPVLLVIDDSATIRKLVELSFKSTDWSVEFAVSGQEGIDAAARRSPDVILLDFVLPDMRGSDVCRKLSEDPRLGAIPVLVMSAKHDNVRELFQEFSAVADFVGKPFAAADIVQRVKLVAEKASRTGKAAEGKSVPASFAQTQLAAQAIYTKMRPQLARIPELMAELGSAAPAGFFARKLLTPQLVEELLSALGPLISDGRGVANPASDGSAFEGELGPLSLLELLELLTSSGKSGKLSVRYSDYELFVYARAGAVVFVSCNNPAVYRRGAKALPEAPSELLARAEAQQRSAGKPLFISLAEAGLLATSELGPLLERHGKRVLLGAMDERGGHFCWRPELAPPSFVAAFARPLSLPDLALQRLRLQGGPSESQRFAPGESAFSRCEQFSAKVRRFELSTEERQLLAAVDGQRTLAGVAAAAGLPSQLAAQILHRLLEVNLVRVAPKPAHTERRGPVLVADPDERDFVEPLRRLLADAKTPFRVVGLAKEESLVDAIRRESPQMVIVNVSSATAEALDAAQALRAYPELDTLRLVALLDAPAPDEVGQLTTAGYEAIFTKPVICADLERLLLAEAV